MSRHIVRSKMATFGLFKSISKTSQAKTLYAHSPTACIKYCKSYRLREDQAYLAHFRKTCQGGVNDCSRYTSETVEDGSILRFKDELVDRVQQTLKDLRFLPP